MQNFNTSSAERDLVQHEKKKQLKKKLFSLTGDYSKDRALLLECFEVDGGAYVTSNDQRVSLSTADKNFYLSCRQKEHYNFSIPEDAKDLVTILERQRDLYSINFHKIILGDVGAVLLSEMLMHSTLHSAKFYDAGISDEGFMAFARMLQVNTHLQELSLDSNAISSITATALAESLEQNFTLKKLMIGHGWGSQIGEVGARALARLLTINRTLEDLEVPFTHIGNAGGILLANALMQNVTLRKLNLWSNDLNDECVYHFAKMLKANSTLRELNLAYNDGISDEGGIFLAEALKHNMGLRVLKVSIKNLNRVNCTSAFAEMLTINQTLEELDLSSIKIFENGDASAIAEALKHNRKLRKLTICMDDISDASVEAFAQMLEVNTTLEELDFSTSDINDAGLTKIANALKRNTTLRKIKFGSGHPSAGKGDIIGKTSARSIIAMLGVNTALQEIDVGVSSISRLDTILIDREYKDKIHRRLERNKVIARGHKIENCFSSVKQAYALIRSETLPEISAECESYSIITPAGLFQLNDSNTDFVRILTSTQLAEIGIEASSAAQELSEDQSDMLNDAIVSHGGYISPFDKQLHLLEKLVPKLIDTKSPLSPTDEIAEGYRLMKAMRQFSFGAIDEALRLLLTDNFTSPKWQNNANTVIAELLLLSEIFDTASAEQRQIRYQLMAHFSQHQPDSAPFRFAVMSLQKSNGEMVSIEDMDATNMHYSAPFYSEGTLQTMCNSIVTRIDDVQSASPEIQANNPAYKAAILNAIRSYNTECTGLTMHMFHKKGIAAINELQTTINSNDNITDAQLNTAVETVLQKGGRRVSHYFSSLRLEAFALLKRGEAAAI